MSDVVNLNRAKKRRKAAAREKDASANRAKYGRTKAEKARDEGRAEALRRHIDAHRRDEE